MSGFVICFLGIDFYAVAQGVESAAEIRHSVIFHNVASQGFLLKNRTAHGFDAVRLQVHVVDGVQSLIENIGCKGLTVFGPHAHNHHIAT